MLMLPQAALTHIASIFPESYSASLTLATLLGSYFQLDELLLNNFSNALGKIMISLNSLHIFSFQ